MKDYSQSGEQIIIKDHFKGFVGTFLDIGANDGKTLSNTYACSIRGWKGLCVEPSVEAFQMLALTYSNNPRVDVLNFGVSDNDERVTFYDSGTHLNQQDVALLSTASEVEMNKWSPYTQYSVTEAYMMTVNKLLEKSRYKTFDLISIDAEGYDLRILEQMNLTELSCKMLIVETNSIEDFRYIDYCARFGMKVFHKNAENLIFTI